ncbi:sensor histidine kinase [Spirosoma rhododendri]|uniref:histidine kinase n=1 Tax=Spirosoma rhododendri TaxID=2728024 RepID=A0A7L5E0K3_9BACT|nr:PAS domain S-box protein [Spirosoma rhododendri]QJD81707.1 PAS domain S-box protein [Spirosoma rhododendri]
MQTKIDLYQKTVPLAQLGIWEHNLLTGELYWNTIVRAIYEVAADFTPSLKQTLQFYPDKEAVRGLINQVLQTHQPKTGVFQLQAISGRVKWVRLRANVHLERDVCTTIHGTLEDITQERASIQANLAQEQQFHQAFDFAPIGMALVSLAGNWLKANDSLCQLLGYTEAELRQITFQEITFGDDLASDLNQMHRLLAGTIDRYSIEKRYIHKRGQLIWTLLHVSLVRDQQNTPLYFVSQIKDISERKNYIELLQWQRQRLDNIIQSTGVGTWEWDVPSDNVICNPRASAIVGYDPDELSDCQMTAWHKLIHPDDQLANTQLLTQCFQHQMDFYVSECRMRHKDGYWIWVEIRGKVMEWTSSGQPRFMLGTYLDIHARRSLQEEQRKTLTVVSNQNSRLLNFAHIVSHNLRSHAGNIQMLTDMLIQEVDEQERQEYITMLQLNATNLQETLLHLNEVINVQAVDKRSKKPVGLRHEVERILTILSEPLRQVEAQVQTEISEQLVVHYDPAYLESVLLNLVSNCIKYRHPDRVLSIRLVALPVAEGHQLQVIDNGVGIDLKRHGHKLFGMYKTFHGNADARGIGLFLIKHQIEAMAGQLSVESQVNAGTTFTVTIQA